MFSRWVRTVPVPLVRVKINGETMLMALDSATAFDSGSQVWTRWKT